MSNVVWPIELLSVKKVQSISTLDYRFRLPIVKKQGYFWLFPPQHGFWEINKTPKIWNEPLNCNKYYGHKTNFCIASWPLQFFDSVCCMWPWFRSSRLESLVYFKSCFSKLRNYLILSDMPAKLRYVVSLWTWLILLKKHTIKITIFSIFSLADYHLLGKKGTYLVSWIVSESLLNKTGMRATIWANI